MSSATPTAQYLPGIAVAALGVLVAWGASTAIGGLPMLTVAVVVGIVIGNVTGVRQYTETSLKPGFAFSAKTLMRAGIVLLGLQVSLLDVAGLGWVTLLLVVGLVALSFVLIWLLGLAFRLPGPQPVLIASGYAICGASAIGAVASVTGAKSKDTATPVALVTLCGTLAIFVLPALQGPLGLDDTAFGHWVGAGVHDVGQVVATAGSVGSAALGAAILVKLTRVLMLAPLVAVVGAVYRRRSGEAADGARPPLVPLFVVGFLAASVLRTTGVLPGEVLEAAAFVQHALLGAALVALGASIKIGRLLTTDLKALVMGLLAWCLIGGLALGAVLLMPA